MIRRLRMTVTALERRIARCFRRLDAKLTERFHGIDQHFERIDRRFERIDQRFEGIDQRVEVSDRRLSRMEQRLLSIDGKLDALIAESQDRVKLETRLFGEMHGRLLDLETGRAVTDEARP